MLAAYMGLDLVKLLSLGQHATNIEATFTDVPYSSPCARH